MPNLQPLLPIDLMCVFLKNNVVVVYIANNPKLANVAFRIDVIDLQLP